MLMGELENQLKEQPIEELLVIAKYMGVENPQELNKDELIDGICRRELGRAPYPDYNGFRFDMDRYSTQGLLERTNKALNEIKEIMRILINK